MTDLERSLAKMDKIRGLSLEDMETINVALGAARREGAERAAEKSYANGFRRGAEEMRERAAQECERHAKFCKDEAHRGGDWSHLQPRFDEATFNAQRIRALPLTPEEPK